MKEVLGLCLNQNIFILGHRMLQFCQMLFGSRHHCHWLWEYWFLRDNGTPLKNDKSHEGWRVGGVVCQ